MSGDASRRATASLAEAKRRFAQWRGGGPRPGRIPRALWTLAAQAAAAHGAERTADALDLDQQRLRQWMRRLGVSVEHSTPAVAEFVELPPLPMGPLAECHLEVEEPCGRKLRVVLKGEAVAQAAAVLPALWKEPRP